MIPNTPAILRKSWTRLTRPWVNRSLIAATSFVAHQPPCGLAVQEAHGQAQQMPKDRAPQVEHDPLSGILQGVYLTVGQPEPQQEKPEVRQGEEPQQPQRSPSQPKEAPGGIPLSASSGAA